MNQSKKHMAQAITHKHEGIFKCPFCNENLKNDLSGLVCLNNHHFDFSKKGTLMLYKTHQLKKDDLYNLDLFESRRKILLNKYYQSLHQIFANVIPSSSLILDMGSGEGSHTKDLLNECTDCTVIGLDLAKDGIYLSSDYLSLGFLPIIADLSQVPLMDDTVDVILNILSPSNELEMKRLLEKEGMIIKVVPGPEYLIEMRHSFGLEPSEIHDYQFNHFDVVDTLVVYDQFSLDSEAQSLFLSMSPMSKHQTSKMDFKTITIDLKVMILKHKEEAL